MCHGSKRGFNSKGMNVCDAGEKDGRFSKLEARVELLELAIREMRDSAIRGEVASGRKSKDVALKFGVTPARVTQIAPRRRYNNG